MHIYIYIYIYKTQRLCVSMGRKGIEDTQKESTNSVKFYHELHELIYNPNPNEIYNIAQTAIQSAKTSSFHGRYIKRKYAF